MADENWVEMRHPDLGEDSVAPHGGNATVNRVAFEEVWKPLGWQEVGTVAAPPPAAFTPPTTTPRTTIPPKENA